MKSKQKQLHVMFLPYMAPGHMMPMIEFTRLFSRFDVKTTIISTTRNAIRLKPTIEFATIRYPCEEVGLPEGCENLTSISTLENTLKFIRGIELMQPHIEKIVRERRPDCIISDYLFPWTVDIADELGIPRLAFSGSGVFNLCVSNSIEKYEPHNNVGSETETFVVPGLPDQVKLTRSQLPDIVKIRTKFSALFDKIKEAEKKSFGVLINSFYELEPDYIDHFRNVMGMKTWHLGPVSLFNKESDNEVNNIAQTDIGVSKHSCFSWLDLREPNSVLYICFGSLTRFTKTQMIEIAEALQESGLYFIWVVGNILKTDNQKDEEQEWWVPEEFEEETRRNDRGLIIRDWAPQVRILEHKAIGGFLTHCGWNSILEGVSAGVPMVTWPIFADQFYNEKLVTQVLKFGVPVGNEWWKVWAMDESPLVTRDKIKNAVCVVTGDGDDALEMRKRASKLAEFAKAAVIEGGSSYKNLKTLIEDIRSYKHSHYN